MKALDFEYDGTLASSKGIVVCSFDSSDDETIDYGSKINFDVTSMRNGKEFELVNSGYDEAGEFIGELVQKGIHFRFFSTLSKVLQRIVRVYSRVVQIITFSMQPLFSLLMRIHISQ